MGDTAADATGNGWTACFEGVVDDLRVHGRTLTPAEVTALAQG
ncbi:hypothetical protein [Streptomyces sp. WELS2]|nr:hypothetical protein [Streptomyces sp. WELS2]